MLNKKYYLLLASQRLIVAFTLLGLTCITQIAHAQKQRLKDCLDFTYQQKTDPRLVQIRQTYKLDSVCGSGADINKAINLLEWMHNAVPHEDEYNHETLNAKFIIDTYKTKRIAQGCYPIAIAMNEIFLSMGFNSRVVICFSSDYDNPNGGHVVNSVYIPSFAKWIMMDAQFNAYLKDESGTYLNVSEVRENLIKKKVMTLNQMANYHGDPVTVEYYLNDFFKEHLYRFICPVISEYNSQTRERGKIMQYVELLPVDAKIPVSGQFESNTADGVQVKTCHTNNVASFWAPPPITVTLNPVSHPDK